jgi:hypothetical protein
MYIPKGYKQTKKTNTICSKILEQQTNVSRKGTEKKIYNETKDNIAPCTSRKDTKKNTVKNNLFENININTTHEYTQQGT